jgi:hypothetical protein
MIEGEKDKAAAEIWAAELTVIISDETVTLFVLKKVSNSNRLRESSPKIILIWSGVSATGSLKAFVSRHP